MALQLGQLTIYSDEPQILGNFFSEMFDTQLIDRPHGYTLADESLLPFKFVKAKNKKNRPLDHYSFLVEDREQLDELKQKVSFFNYRHHLGDQSFELDELDHSFTVTDIDGRIWEFTVRQ